MTPMTPMPIRPDKIGGTNAVPTGGIVAATLGSLGSLGMPKSGDPNDPNAFLSLQN
jgi:hypothetical protein